VTESVGSSGLIGWAGWVLAGAAAVSGLSRWTRRVLAGAAGVSRLPGGTRFDLLWLLARAGAVRTERLAVGAFVGRGLGRRRGGRLGGGWTRARRTGRWNRRWAASIYLAGGLNDQAGGSPPPGDGSQWQEWRAAGASIVAKAYLVVDETPPNSDSEVHRVVVIVQSAKTGDGKLVDELRTTAWVTANRADNAWRVTNISSEIHRIVLFCKRIRRQGNCRAEAQLMDGPFARFGNRPPIAPITPPATTRMEPYAGPVDASAVIA
jgi:hypothetical protein